VLKETQVVLGPGAVARFLPQPVVGQAKPTVREQVVAVAVVRKRARLTHQAVDDVAVVDRVPIAAHQPRQRIDLRLRVPHLDPVGVQTRLDLLADQPTVHRIRVAVDVDQAARVDATVQPQATRQPGRRQRPQRCQFLGQTRATAGVARRHHALQEGDVLVAAGEVATPPHQERLAHGRLEVAVRRLAVAVLVRLADVDPLARHAVMAEQIAVARLELPLRRQVVDRRAEAVAAVPPRHAAQLPKRVLQPLRQRLERLRGTDAHRLPVRVGQDEVVHQVIERLPLDGHAERVHGREIGRGQIAGGVDLAEHHLAARPGHRSPGLHAPLERTAMAVGELPGVLGPQPVEQGLGPQPRFGLQPRRHLGPDRGERVESRAIGPRPFAVGRQSSRRAIPTGRRLVHACPPGGLCQRRPRRQIAKQLADLAVRNHRKSPGVRELRT
jgi:hypothetical protein